MPDPTRPPTPPQPVYVSTPTTPGTAVVSLVLGILGLVMCPLLGTVGLLLAYPARRQIRNSNGRLGGDGVAVAGMVLGWICTIIVTLFVVVVLGSVLLMLLGLAAASSQHS